MQRRSSIRQRMMFRAKHAESQLRTVFNNGYDGGLKWALYYQKKT
jgi:hypothetical protein